jgi:hypothetical protein
MSDSPVIEELPDKKEEKVDKFNNDFPPDLDVGNYALFDKDNGSEFDDDEKKRNGIFGHSLGNGYICTGEVIALANGTYLVKCEPRSDFIKEHGEDALEDKVKHPEISTVVSDGKIEMTKGYVDRNLKVDMSDPAGPKKPLKMLDVNKVDGKLVVTNSNGPKVFANGAVKGETTETTVEFKNGAIIMTQGTENTHLPFDEKKWLADNKKRHELSDKDKNDKSIKHTVEEIPSFVNVRFDKNYESQDNPDTSKKPTNPAINPTDLKNKTQGTTLSNSK